MASYVTYAKDINGSPVIPASQRPDGTWRKQRRVKEGYVPQEEVPLYESKGKQIAKNKPKLPPGFNPDIVPEPPKPLPSINAHLPIDKKSPIPGLIVDEDYMKKIKNKKKNKSSNVDNLNEKISNISLESKKGQSKQDTKKQTLTKSDTINQQQNVLSNTDPSKRLKNLKKKLREIETLEEKIKNGEIKKPETDQLEKIGRKKQVQKEIDELEKKL